MKKACPHCGFGVKKWHKRCGLQKLDKGSVEAGVSIVGRAGVKRETIVMVYVCELTNLSFLVAVRKAREER